MLKNIKYIILIIICLQHFSSIEAQKSTKLSSNFIFDGLAVNPAFAGRNDVFTTNLSYRNQWLGFEGAPVNYNLSIHTPLKNTKIGLGIVVEYESIGSRQYTSYFLNYAYRIQMDRNYLTFGLRAGMSTGKILPIDLGEGEWFISDKSENFMIPNFGIGAMFYGSNYSIGFSIPLLLGYENSGTSGLNAYHDPKQYSYYLNGTADFEFNSDWSMQPSILLLYANSINILADINCKIKYKNSLAGGLGFRYKEAIKLLLDYRLNYQMIVGLAYDFGINELSNYHNGSFEIAIQYEFKYKVNVVNPSKF